MQDIAATVRNVLTTRGVTQTELADRIGLEPSKMSKAMNGTRRFTSLELARIAESLGTGVDDLLGLAQPSPKIAARVADAGVRALPHAVDDAVNVAQSLVEHRQNLSSLGYRQQALPGLPPLSGSASAQGEALAQWAHVHAGVGRDVLARDIAETIEHHFGIDVAIRKFPGRFDGLAWSGEDANLIVAATTQVPGRQRFTVAHELAHILTSDNQLTVDENLDSEATGPSEQRANAFASAFLMPRNLIEGNVPRTLDEFCALSCDLSVTPVALGYRLKNLGMMTEESRRQYVDGLSARTAAARVGRSEEFMGWLEYSSRERTPQFLLRDSWNAYEEGLTTLRPYAALLGVDADQLYRGLRES